MLIRFCWRMTLPSLSTPLLIDCLSSCPLTCWEGRSEDSSCNCRFVRCSFPFESLLHILCGSVVWCLHVQDRYVLLRIHSLSPCNGYSCRWSFSLLKVYLILTQPLLLSFDSYQYIIFRPFTFDLPALLFRSEILTGSIWSSHIF